MLQREVGSTYTCPDCGTRLASNRDLFYCQEHGAFFAYGPQLLVRAPQLNEQPRDILLPWEKENSQRTA